MAVAYAPHDADAAAIGMLQARFERPAEDPRIRWRQTARPEQLLPALDDTWRVIYFQGGRGSGKTRAAAQGLSDLMLGDTDGEGEYGIIGPTYADAWTKCVEGESGLLKALGTSMAEIKDHRSKTVRSAWRTYGQVILHNGVVVYVDSAAEGGLRVQGRNLKAIWADEIGLWEKWDTAWKESIRYAVRTGVSKIICDGTPKASRPAAKLVRSLIRNDPAEGGVIVRRLRTVDNRANLSAEFYRSVVNANKGTRLERQELEGELLDDVANALWTRDQLDAIQVPTIGGPNGSPFLRNAIIGVDPSDGAESSDEQAYTIMGLGFGELQPKVYVAENWGGQEAPAPFARRVVLKAVQWQADLVVEKNHGGAWLVAVFDQTMRQLDAEGLLPDGHRPRVHVVHASQSKRTRAEPCSALYHRDLVRHCKMTGKDAEGHDLVEGMVELEDQMSTFTGAADERSPDRLDSLVWGMTKFLYLSSKPPEAAQSYSWGADSSDPMYEAAGGLGFDPAAPSQQQALMSKIQRPVPPEPWDIGEFAPQDDPDAKRTQSAAVQSWR